MNFRNVVVMMLAIFVMPVFASVSPEALDLYYRDQPKEAVGILLKQNDPYSQIFLAKSYYALEQPADAYRVISRVKMNPKTDTNAALYVTYLRTVSAPDLTAQVLINGSTPRSWMDWPRAFRNRARWLIAMECLRKNKGIKAEQLLLSLRNDGYSPREVRVNLVNAALVSNNPDKAFQYYKNLLTEFPDADASRQMFSDVQKLRKSSVEWSWDVLFTDSNSLLVVFQNARKQNLKTVVLDIGSVLINVYGLNDREFIFAMAQANFDKKIYDKSLFYLRFLTDSVVDDSLALRSLFLRGQCYQKTKDYDLAISDYQKY